MRATLKHEAINCPNCPLSRTTTRPYIPCDITHNKLKGEAVTVDVLFVGDSPGNEEDRLGIPFVGPAGTLLRETIAQNANGASFAFSNVLRCRPSTKENGSRTPSATEIGFCLNYTQTDIAQLQPKVVVLLGSVAIKSLNPDSSDEAWIQGKVNLARSKTFKEKEGVKYVASLHPNAVLQNNNQKNIFCADIQAAFNLASGKENKFAKMGTVTLLDTLDKINEFLAKVAALTKSDFIAFDTETTTVNRVGPNQLLTLQFAFEENHAYVVPYMYPNSWSDSDFEKVKEKLFQLFSFTGYKFSYWAMHNSGFDLNKVQRFLGVKKVAKPIFDTLFAMYIYDENRTGMESVHGPYSLKTLAPELLGFRHYDKEALRKRESGGLATSSLKDLSDYGGMDAYVTYRLKLKILELAGSYAAKLKKFCLKWYDKVVRVSMQIELNGIYVDRKQLAYLKGEDSPILKRVEEIHVDLLDSPEAKSTNKILNKLDARTSGMKSLFSKKEPWLFDPFKKEHQLVMLFDVLNIEPTSYGKDATPRWPEGVPSVDKLFYAEHEKTYQQVALMSEYAGLKKLKTSYVNSITSFLEENEDMQDTRVRPSLLWFRTVTGRAAQKDPNMQQVPRPDKPFKKEIKSLFTASPGNILIEADYAQAEVRWWAQISEDKEYAAVFNRMLELKQSYRKNPTKELKLRIDLECDVHKQAAALMNRIAVADVTKDQRQGAKNLVFGAIYGQSIQALAKILKISEDDAGKLQAQFLNAFKRAAGWLIQTEKDAFEHLYVDTAFGRRRHLAYLIQSGQKPLMNMAKRVARNAPIQGTSSDMLALAAFDVQEYINDNDKPWKIENLVHDAMLLEVPLDADHIDQACKVMNKHMTQLDLKTDWGINMIVPFETDMKIGTRWGHCSSAENDEELEKLVAKEVEYSKSRGWL